MSGGAKRGFWLAAATVPLLAGLLKPLQDRLDAVSGPASTDPDRMYLTSPATIRRMALGYDSLLADVYWMRAIQYYGRRDEADRRRVRYGNLATLLDVTTTLDPDFIDVYRFGSSFLSEPDPVGAGRPDEAVRLLEKGIRRHPSEWRLRYDKGFVYWGYLKDFEKAAQAFLDAGRVPGAPPWLDGLAALALSKGGQVETARELWTRQYQESTREDVRQNARNHLASIQVDEDLWTLEFLIERFRAKAGVHPGSLGDLVRPGWLAGVPLDPAGVPYSYDPATGKAELGSQSRVRRLKLPYDYRTAFRQKLAKVFAGN